MAVDLKAMYPGYKGSKYRLHFKDYRRIQQIMLNRDNFLSLADVLNTDVAQERNNDEAVERDKYGLRDKGVLARVLRTKEQSHGFRAAPREIPIWTGVVSEATFLNTISQGHVMKDVGVSFQHGEYTHRIQWYIVMVDYEQNGALYHKTPLELYKTIYRLGPTARPTGNRMNMWDCLFDRASFDDWGEHQVTYPDPGNYFMARTPGSVFDCVFTCPENLNAYLLDPELGGLRLKHLHAVLRRRHNKRTVNGESAQAFNTFKEQYILKLQTEKRFKTAWWGQDKNTVWWKK